MFVLERSPARLCDGVNRREWLRLGGLSAVGLSLPALLAARAQAAPQGSRGGSFGRAKSCILLFLAGGPPQHETWDPKPDASVDIRGDIGAIASSVPGLQVGELMPLLAKQAHQWSVLRAVRTEDNAHSASGYYMLTGLPHTPKNQENATSQVPNDWPCFGAVVGRLKGARGDLPAAVTLPEQIWNTGMIPWPGQDAGWLGRPHDPWLLTCDPNSPKFGVPGLELHAGLSTVRVDERLALHAQLNRRLEKLDGSGTFDRHNVWMQKAFELMRTAGARQAFDLEQEGAAVRDRYGRHRWGQSVLLARRLVEHGVSLVQVNWTREPNGSSDNPMWDTHRDNAGRLRNNLMPPMDQACSALIDDLAAKGLLDETLVVMMGEFGRSPKINGAGGRDHWGNVFSVALAGGGIRPGIVYGRSDAIGGEPKDGVVKPEALTATIFHCLGLRPEDTIQDLRGRPHPISRGEPVRAIL